MSRAAVFVRRGVAGLGLLAVLAGGLVLSATVGCKAGASGGVAMMDTGHPAGFTGAGTSIPSNGETAGRREDSGNLTSCGPCPQVQSVGAEGGASIQQPAASDQEWDYERDGC